MAPTAKHLALSRFFSNEGNLHAKRYPPHPKYLGDKAFPKDITEFEIHEFFTLSAADLRAIRVDSNKRSRLALASPGGATRNG